MKQIVNQKWIAKDGAFLFFKLGVFYHEHPDPAQVGHEFKHFQQCQGMPAGYIQFLITLGLQTLIKRIKHKTWIEAYRNAPLEKQARESEEEFVDDWLYSELETMQEFLDWKVENG